MAQICGSHSRPWTDPRENELIHEKRTVPFSSTQWSELIFYVACESLRLYKPRLPWITYHDGFFLQVYYISTWWSDPRRHGWITLHLEAQAEDQKHIPLQKSWKKEEEWGISNRPSALSCEALLLLGVGDSPGDESQPRTQSWRTWSPRHQNGNQEESRRTALNPHSDHHHRSPIPVLWIRPSPP